MDQDRNYLSDSFGDFLFNNDEYLWTPVRTYYKEEAFVIIILLFQLAFITVFLLFSLALLPFS